MLFMDRRSLIYNVLHEGLNLPEGLNLVKKPKVGMDYLRDLYFMFENAGYPVASWDDILASRFTVVVNSDVHLYVSYIANVDKIDIVLDKRYDADNWDTPDGFSVYIEDFDITQMFDRLRELAEKWEFDLVI